MEHIRQFDWCSSRPDTYFISESDIDNSVTEKILRNKFFDPLISSDSEDDSKPKEKINWDEIFKKKKNDKVHRTVVPGFHPVPPFPKLSSLNGQQHYQLLKVLCAQNPDILPGEFIGRPSKQDHRIFEELKEAYAKEQKEFKDWAKTMWTSNHCVRALRPKPPIELVYDAEFKMAAHRLESFPKNYSLAAQIPLESANANCELVHEKVLIKVNNSSLPQIEIPDMSSRVYILNPYPAPEPCSKHPCRFTLPNESSMSILPLTEVQRELAQYAADNGAQYIASEEALRCLVEVGRRWLLALSVCQVMSMDGTPVPVVVLDGEFALQREAAPARTLKAFRRLLEHALVPPLEVKQANNKSEPAPTNKQAASTKQATNGADDMDDSDEDDDHLVIDTDDLPNTTDEQTAMETECSEENDKEEGSKHSEKGSKENDKSSKEKTTDAQNTSFDNSFDFFNCTCRDTFDKPPLRSYKKWKVVNKGTNDKYSIIVHTPHRAKGPGGEVVMEAVPEYQLELGASELPPHTVRSQALALMLRKNASILNVRIDSATGEIVTTESVYHEDFVKEHSDVVASVSSRLFTALDQLQGLLPGHYVLQHELAHGNNAILYRPVPGADGLALHFECATLADADEAKSVRAPPTISPALLPIHKYRRILPCAFTPYPNQLPREPRRPATRQKTPPQAIKWPKRKGKKKKKNNNNSNNN
ncbi:hypothetical protein ABMA27_015726 [Loxostege sticticalis]|uniref:Little elongation complex subunit 2 C-terminal domain-containing protein n=1 Tax=Loxostege sticticalis TaxID=481309 RepID=A0ABR3I444_LOXSC